MLSEYHEVKAVYLQWPNSVLPSMQL